MEKYKYGTLILLATMVNLMWKEYLDKRLNVKLLSVNYKRSILFNHSYSAVNQLWGRYRLKNIASEIKRKGERIIDLTDGLEETVGENGELRWADPPEWLMESVKGSLGTYKDVVKKESEMKQFIAEEYKEKYGLEIDAASEILYCVGGAFVCDAAARLIADPGDEVLVMDPDYVTYAAQVASTGAKPVPVPLKEENGEWHFDVEALESRVNPTTRLLMMSNANNPSGFFYTEDDLKAIAELAGKYDFMVFHDQVAEEFVLDEGYKLNCIAALPGMKESAILGSSFSKMYNLHGWRTGFMVANKDFCEAAGQFQGWVNDGAVAPGIYFAHAILSDENRKERRKWVDHRCAELRKKRNYLKKRLGEIDGVIPNTCRGHYWAWPNVKSFGITSQELAEYLLKEAKLYVRPGTWYGMNGEGHFRLNFFLPMDYLEKAMNKMEEGLSKFRRERAC